MSCPLFLKCVSSNQVRGDFGLGVNFNLCHGIDSLEASEKEIELWFRPTNQTSAAAVAKFEPPPLERTFIMIKPDGVQRGLSGRILSRFEDKGLRLVASKHLEKVSRELLEKHYAHLVNEPYFEKEVVPYMCSGRVHAMAFQGVNAVAAGSTLLGATNPLEAQLGTVRGDFGLCIEQNVCHCSRSAAAAEREIALWFDSSELVNWIPPEVLVKPEPPVLAAK